MVHTIFIFNQEILCIYSLYWNYFLSLIRLASGTANCGALSDTLFLDFYNHYGQENQEGWNHREVRNPLRCQPQEDRQEDGDLAAQQVPLHLLRKGQDEETGVNFVKCIKCSVSIIIQLIGFHTSHEIDIFQDTDRTV